MRAKYNASLSGFLIRGFLTMIVIDESKNPENFTSQQWLHFSTSDRKEVLTLTGVIILTVVTNTSSWKRDKIKVFLKYPSAMQAYRGDQERAFQIEHWVVSIVPTAFSSKPSWAGIAVDGFGSAFVGNITSDIPIVADIATMGDVQFNRLAYNLTITGTFVWTTMPN